MSQQKKNGYWCVSCRYGAVGARIWIKCPNCGSQEGTMESPLPSKPADGFRGSGQATGITEIRRHGSRPAKGTARPKILRKLEARKKQCAAQKPGKFTPTMPGSMKKGGGI
jgi:hypothetical protein